MLIRTFLMFALAMLLAGREAAYAADAQDQRPLRGNAATPLSREIERQAHRLVRAESESPPSQVGRPAQTQTRSRLAKCSSRKKGAFVGAAVGALAGAAFGMYVANAASSVPGAAAGGPTVIAYSTMAVGGAGAFVGLLYCS
jgi:hypothetical protein